MSLDLLADEELTDDALTARLRVYQRRRGHRYSLDDLATAWLALHMQPAARTCLDLGCGLGSVLLMAADMLPNAELWGVEAQDISYALAQRNVARNELAGRVRVVQGDLRDACLIARLKAELGAAGLGDGFALVTGTPPYKPPGTATLSPDSQRAHARSELRGGIEDYLLAASRSLAPQGVAVVCAESSAHGRTALGARAASLAWLACLDVVPMEGRKARLFSVQVLVPLAARELMCERLGLQPTAAESEPVMLPPLIARDAQGARTEAAHELRRFFGFDPNPDELASPPERARHGANAQPRKPG